MHLYFHSSSTYRFIHIYITFFNRGVCSYIIHMIYVFIPENMLIFLSFDSIVWFLW